MVGFGFAGAAAAVAAADAGLSVLVLEKQDLPGGISITSGGGVAAARDACAAFGCLRTACGGRTPDPVLRAFAQGLTEIESWLRSLTADGQYQIAYAPGDVGYDLPGRSAVGWVKISPGLHAEGRQEPPGLRGGARLFRLLQDAVTRRDITVLTGTPARRLLRTDCGGVNGVTARRDGKDVIFRAHRGVILACGGFEWDTAMKQHYFEAVPVLPVTGRGNTGDGIRMAQAVGAGLWHMWHFHGAYGFHPPGFDMAVRHRFSGQRKPDSPVPWIVVDQDGRRYMNEVHPAPEDTNARPMQLFDPDRTGYPRIPSFAVFDDEARRRGPIGFPIRDPNGGPEYEWSQDNQKETRAGWIYRSDTLAELVQAARERHGVILRRLPETVERWNRQVGAGVDEDWGRPPGTMLPILSPPFHLVPVWPIVSNTQGGPWHDEHWRVLDAFGAPISGLYVAGELGSIFGHLYLLGGNLAECLVGGWVAARHAASQPGT